MKLYRINPDSDPIYASHQLITDRSIKEQLCSDTFEFMNTAYKYIGGFHSFDGESNFLDKSYLWYITYDGPLDDMKDFDISKVYTISVFKQKFGLKLVGAGNNRYYGVEDDEERKTKKLKASDALKQQLKWALNHGWIEASGALEVLKNMNGTRVVVTPGMIELGKLEEEKNYEFGKKIAVSSDYVILIGEKKTKVIYDALVDSKFDKDSIFVLNNVSDAYGIINSLKEDGVDIYALFENDLPDIYVEGKK